MSKRYLVKMALRMNLSQAQKNLISLLKQLNQNTEDMDGGDYNNYTTKNNLLIMYIRKL